VLGLAGFLATAALVAAAPVPDDIQPPALMQTDIAVESADIIIVRDDLRAVLTARELSRSAYRRTRQNVGLAFLFNGQDLRSSPRLAWHHVGGQH
jgi:hypothetical protein